MGLGSINVVSLAEARLKAADAQRQLYDGIDPLAAKQTATRQHQAPTFAVAAKTYIDIHRSTWRNPKHANQWRNTLRDYAGPVIGTLRVDTITRQHVLDILNPIWLDKPETASRVRGRIEKILDWAKAEGFCVGENPAQLKGNLEHSLPKRNKVSGQRHHKALPWNALPDFYARLLNQEGVAALALRFTILTAVRTTETRFATSAEFDLDAPQPLWTIPEERMKAGKEHRVPLAPPAVALVKAGGLENAYVFSPFADKALSENGMLALLKRMNATGITVHGFRSTFRDWTADTTNVPRAVVETSLAHQNPNQVEAAYLRTDMLQKRATLMQQWAEFVVSNV